MTRCARELERRLRQAEDCAPVEEARLEAIRHSAMVGLAEWSAARELVKLSQQTQSLLKDDRARLTEDELTEVLTEFADGLETRLRLVRAWSEAPELVAR